MNQCKQSHFYIPHANILFVFFLLTLKQHLPCLLAWKQLILTFTSKNRVIYLLLRHSHYVHHLKSNQISCHTKTSYWNEFTLIHSTNTYTFGNLIRCTIIIDATHINSFSDYSFTIHRLPSHVSPSRQSYPNQLNQIWIIWLRKCKQSLFVVHKVICFHLE